MGLVFHPVPCGSRGERFGVEAAQKQMARWIVPVVHLPKCSIRVPGLVRVIKCLCVCVCACVRACVFTAYFETYHNGVSDVKSENRVKEDLIEVCYWLSLWMLHVLQWQSKKRICQKSEHHELYSYSCSYSHKGTQTQASLGAKLDSLR